MKGPRPVARQPDFPIWDSFDLATAGTFSITHYTFPLYLEMSSDFLGSSVLRSPLDI